MVNGNLNYNDINSQVYKFNLMPIKTPVPFNESIQLKVYIEKATKQVYQVKKEE